VKDTESRQVIKLLEWPQLVGMDGEVAVDIIKKETGKFMMIHIII
jgi:hypothetical protein